MERKVKYVQFDSGLELVFAIDTSKKAFERAEVMQNIEAYDVMRLYTLPPFLDRDGGRVDIETTTQPIILFKWLPWSDAEFLNIPFDKILVLTDLNGYMTKYYHRIVGVYEKFKDEGRDTMVSPSDSDYLLDEHEDDHEDEIERAMREIMNMPKKKLN